MKKGFLVSVFIVLIVNIYKAQVNFTESNLPIFIIETGNKTIVDEPKIVAQLKIIDNGSGKRNRITDLPTGYAGKIGIEIRGSSSQMFPKKQYGFEIYNDAEEGINVSLLGLPKEEDWILNAPYTDKSLIRNALAYKWGSALGNYAPRTKFCEVVINGAYKGVFSLIEKIKRDNNRVNISKLDATTTTGNALTGGYIIKIDKQTGSGGTGWHSPYFPINRKGAQTIFYQYEYPDSDDINAKQKEYIQGYVTDFEQSLLQSNFNDPLKGFRKYIDENAFIDYLIVNELTKNPDAYRLSTFLYKKRDDLGGKLFMGPIWDFDLALGNVNFCANGNPEGFVFEYNSICPEDYWLIPFWWKRMLEDPLFVQRLNDRWKALRKTVYSTEKLWSDIDSMSNLLSESQARNFKEWPVLGSYIWPNFYVSKTYNEEIVWLKNWVKLRTAWLDNQFQSKFEEFKVRESGINNVYPNPVPDFLTIQTTIYKPGPFQFKIVDQQGRLCYTNNSVETNIGYLEKKIDMTNFGTGIYYLIIENGQNVSTSTFVKQ
ncbi:MAG: CotH kinase family protein [Saprospiraceae bacterium]|nr:CotH kinase family protein [Saprospiraceae bacterium]